MGMPKITRTDGQKERATKIISEMNTYYYRTKDLPPFVIKVLLNGCG